MAFIETRILDCFDLGQQREIVMQKEIGVTKFGFTQSILVSPPYGQFIWNLNTSGLNVNDKSKIKTFIATGADGFRFKDVKDYQATGEYIGTVNTTPTTLQMRKLYDFGTSEVYKPIRKIVTGTVTIYDDGLPTLTGWSLDVNTGLLTVDGFTGVVTADFQHDWPVIFENNILTETNATVFTNDYSNIILRELLKL